MAYSQIRPLVALITGGTGFIGSQVARQLVKNGWNVQVITRPKSDLSQLDGILESLTIHEHDGTTERMFSILQTAKPDIVFHLASLNKSNHTSDDVVHMLNSNIVFSTQLVEAMLDSGVHYLVNTGTCLQHFENRDYSPTCLYAATKQAFQDIVTFYAETTPLQAVTLKLSNSYGPNDIRPRIISLLQKTAKSNETLRLSPGEQLLDLVYIDDIVDAYLIAADALLTGQIGNNQAYTITSQNPIRLKDLVKVFEKLIGTQLPIDWGARPYYSRETMIPWNIGNRLPNWEAKIGFEEGINRLLQDAKEQSD